MSPTLKRKLHKWAALAVCVPLALWCLSGLVMMLPWGWVNGPEPPRDASPAGLDPSAIDASIPRVVAAARDSAASGSPPIAGIALRLLGGAPAWEVSFSDGARRLVDARTGERLIIDGSLAEREARRLVPADAAVVANQRIEQTDYHYYGAVPAFRIAFDDPAATIVYVSARDGAVDRWTRRRRVHNWLKSLHTFGPLRLLWEEPLFRKGTLAIWTLVALAALATGLWILLPLRRAPSR